MRLWCIGAFMGLVLAIGSGPAGATDVLSEAACRHAEVRRDGVRAERQMSGRRGQSVTGGDRGARGGGQAMARVRKCVPRPQ